MLQKKEQNRPGFMFSIITDGLFIFYQYAGAIIAFVVTIFSVGYYSIGFVIDCGTDVKARVLGSFGVGCTLLSLFSFVLIVLSYLWSFPLQLGAFAILMFAIFVLLRGIWSGEFNNLYNPGAFAIATTLFFLLLTRLAFLKYILLPPYSDSPVHYKIVSDFLHPAADNISNFSLQTIFSNYYHFGFHSLVVWLASITGFEPDKMISLVGQLSLFIAPISIMFLVYTLTHSYSGALFAFLLVAVGWLMPSFAVNWGKYPALLSVAIVPVVASFPLLLLNNKSKRTKVLFYGLILLGGITFIHTRIIICLFFAYTGFYIGNKLQINEEFGYFQSVRYTLLFMLFMWPLSDSLVDFYNNVPILMVLLALMPFAFQSYPAASIGVLVFLSGLSLGTLIPNLLNIGGHTLLDRQFLAMILYIPFSLMGGLGLAGLVRKTGTNIILKRVVMLALLACVFINVTSQSFYPDRCCNYFNENDRLAFQWIRDGSSSHALYLISTFNDGNRAYGTDAGIWIFPLTKIVTNKLPFNISWNSANLFDEVCSTGMGEVYIYMGGKDASFDDSQLARLQWVTPVFRAGEIVIYKISDCIKYMGKE